MKFNQNTNPLLSSIEPTPTLMKVPTYNNENNNIDALYEQLKDFNDGDDLSTLSASHLSTANAPSEQSGIKPGIGDTPHMNGSMGSGRVIANNTGGK